MELSICGENSPTGARVLWAGDRRACGRQCLYCRECGTVLPLAADQLRPWAALEAGRPVNLLWPGRDGRAEALASLAARLVSFGAGEVRLTLGPASVLSRSDFKSFKEAGITSLGVAQLAVWKDLDAALRPGDPARDWWEGAWSMLPEALAVFGPGRVRLHLVLGPGETEEQAVGAVQAAHLLGVRPLVRPLRPNPDLKFTPVSQGKIYRILAARSLIQSGLSSAEQMQFNEYGQVIHYGVAVERLESVMRGGVAGEDLLDCVDCENFCRQREWAAWLEALEPAGEPLAARMRRLCDINWEEAWSNSGRVFRLGKFAFNEAEIEAEAGSPYAMIAAFAPGADDDD